MQEVNSHAAPKPKVPNIERKDTATPLLPKTATPPAPTALIPHFVIFLYLSG